MIPAIDEATDVKRAAKEHGWRAVSRIEVLRGMALDSGDEEEAACWDAKWHVARREVGRRDHRYWTILGIASGLLGLVFGAIVQVGVGALWFSVLAAFVGAGVFAGVALYLAEIILWIAGITLLGGVLVFGYQVLQWLRFGLWESMSLLAGMSAIGLADRYPTFATGWVGVDRIVDGALTWGLDISLALSLLVLGFIVGSIGFLAEGMPFKPPSFKDTS